MDIDSVLEWVAGVAVVIIFIVSMANLFLDDLLDIISRWKNRD